MVSAQREGLEVVVSVPQVGISATLQLCWVHGFVFLRSGWISRPRLPLFSRASSSRVLVSSLSPLLSSFYRWWQMFLVLIWVCRYITSLFFHYALAVASAGKKVMYCTTKTRIQSSLQRMPSAWENEEDSLQAIQIKYALLMSSFVADFLPIYREWSVTPNFVGQHPLTPRVTKPPYR